MIDPARRARPGDAIGVAGRLALDPGEVHVWRAALDPPRPGRSEPSPHLSPEERRRVARLRRPLDRARSARRRGILRELLGAYLGMPPHALQLGTGALDKPELRDPACDLHFNVSGSAGRALFAFARGRAVGVDLEALRDLPDAPALARRFFAPDERRALAALPPARRRRAFFRCWTRKEAWLKATGEGLTRPLDGFAVGLEPDAARLLAVDDEPDAPDRWSLLPLAAGPGFEAALAVAGPAPALRLLDWPDRLGGPV